MTHNSNKAIFQKGTWLYISKRLVMANTTDIAIFQNKQPGQYFKQIYIAGRTRPHMLQTWLNV